MGGHTQTRTLEKKFRKAKARLQGKLKEGLPHKRWSCGRGGREKTNTCGEKPRWFVGKKGGNPLMRHRGLPVEKGAPWDCWNPISVLIGGRSAQGVLLTNCFAPAYKGRILSGNSKNKHPTRKSNIRCRQGKVKPSGKGKRVLCGTMGFKKAKFTGGGEKRQCRPGRPPLHWCTGWTEQYSEKKKVFESEMLREKNIFRKGPGATWVVDTAKFEG